MDTTMISQYTGLDTEVNNYENVNFNRMKLEASETID